MFLGQSAQDVIDLQLPGTSPAPSGVTADISVSEPGTPSYAAPGVTGNYPILAAIGRLLPAGISAYQQIQLQNLNMNLVRQGKPPLTAQQMAMMAPQLNIGVAPATQTMLMYGAIGIGAMFLLSQLGKHSRRAKA